MNIYLIKRGAKPSYQKAPFHPFIICESRKVAFNEAGCTADGAWVWQHFGTKHELLSSGMLLIRWSGYDIDYGGVGRTFTTWDGTHTGFFHEREFEPWTLLKRAVWWSIKPMPQKLMEAGVIYPPDKWTRDRILDQFLPLGGEPPKRSRKEDVAAISVHFGFFGADRTDDYPEFWPPVREDV